MVERIVFMQIEDNMVTFERENGDTIIYPISFVPYSYNEGDIIMAIVHDENFIEFLEIDIDEMKVRHSNLKEKKSKFRSRLRR